MFASGSPPHIPVYANLYGGFAQNTLTTAGTYYAFGSGTGSVAWTSSGSKGITTSGTTQTITIPGIYRVGFSYDMAAFSAANNFTIGIFQNAALAGGSGSLFQSASGAVYLPHNLAGEIVVTANVGDTFNLYITASANSVTPFTTFSTFYLVMA